MHDTAMEIGCLVMDRYADLARAKVLELGSLDVNGSLRSHAPSTTEYVGLDLQAGPGVDFVVEAGKPWPVENNYFDLVMASSVFEHDPMFWLTFLQMIEKVKTGGYIYISAPSNGSVHRYPQDSWRFYPDSGVALMRWAESQGHQVRLIESFTAGRKGDQWNDFVAIFRKGRSKKGLPSVFVYSEFSSFNVLTWQSDDLINPTSSTEDMLIMQKMIARAEEVEAKLEIAALEGRQHIERLGELERELIVKGAQLSQEQAAHEISRKEMITLGGSIERKDSELGALQAELAAQQERLLAQEVQNEALTKQIAEIETALAAADQLVNELATLRDRLALSESTLLQRAEEIEQTRAELAQFRADYEAVVEQRDELTSQLADANAWVFKLAGERKHWESEAIRAQRELSDGEAEARRQLASMSERLERSQIESSGIMARAAEAEAKLEQRLVEIGRLTETLEGVAREAATAKEDLATLEAKMEARVGELVKLTEALRDSEQERHSMEVATTRMETELSRRSTEIAELTKALEESGFEVEELLATVRRQEEALLIAEQNSRGAEEKLAVRHSELARLTVMLAERGAEAGESVTRIEWLRKIALASENMPKWWKILPMKWRRQREHAFLLRAGLFDARSYLEAYPDVARAGMDPVRHYIAHGLDEGRRLF